MKLALFILFAFVGSSFIDLDQLAIGDKAPKAELKMMGIDGKSNSLKDLRKENGLCVIFSCNTCPYVVAWEDRYNELNQYCTENKIGFVLVNSNEAKRNGDDSMAEMKDHAKTKGYDGIAYVVDEKHELADAFGATKTPDVFLFNEKMELAYKGSIDDNSKDKNAVEEPYLKKALKSMKAGLPIDPKETKSIGCSIKRTS